MVEIRKSLEDLVLQSDDCSTDFLRYCLSDRVPYRLDTVTENIVTPVSYASTLVKHKYDDIRQRFFQDKLPDIHVPDELIKAWIFDRTIINACLFRNSVLRPHSTDAVDEVMSRTGSFLLRIDQQRVTNSHYSGLADFASLNESAIHYYKGSFHCNDLSILNRVIQGVGNITDANWILHSEIWQSVCLHRFSVLKVLRNFLHAAIVSYLMADEYVPAVCNLSRGDLLHLMGEFVELRESPDTNKEQVKEFVNRLSMYFDQVGTNVFFSVLIERTFDVYQHVHQQQYGSRFDLPED